ncbi:MAG: L-threonylcarbamoyladenylate synthase [Myxococcota bacterium]|nr:L-threonylcarbamoyladenylate synthase [Myxococcota bacterium]
MPRTRTLPPTDDGVRDAAAILARGGLLGLPTETVYGLAAHAFDPEAVLSVFRAKERPAFDPLIVHLAEPSLDAAVDAGVIDGARLSPEARANVERLLPLWPGPLTLVLPRGARVPELATSGLDTVAVRVPAHPLARAVIRALGAPVVAPSANRFGRISPTEAAHVIDELDGRLDAVLDGGPCALGVESTIVGLEDDGTPRLLRPGACPIERIEAALGRALQPPRRTAAPHAPGMLASHYAPRKRLLLVDASSALTVAPPEGRAAFLVFEPDATRTLEAAFGAPAAVEALGVDVDAAARRLFGALRRLDASDADFLVATMPPVRAGLGVAIADRLARASAER